MIKNMHKKVIFLILVVLCSIFFQGCQTGSFRFKQPLENEGELYVYIKPFPNEAERLSFKLESISALRSDGSEFKLTLILDKFGFFEIGRQRLIATGILPPGNYAGLRLKASNASLKTEEGERSLFISDVSSQLDFQFQVERTKASMISMSFKYAESVSDKFSFTPSFSVFIPERTIPGLVGYVSNYSDNSIMVFDKKKLEITGVISTEAGPKGMALDNLLKKTYISIYDEDMVFVYDISSNRLINIIRLDIGDNPGEILLSQDGQFLFTANNGSDTVSIVNTGSSLVMEKVQVGDGPNSLLIDNSGRHIYVFNTLSNNISIIDVATRKVSATIPTEHGPLRGQLSREGDKLFVIHESSPYLLVFDTSTLALLRRESIGMGAKFIKVDKRTGFFYIANEYKNEIAIYNPFSFIPMDYILTKGAVNYMTIDGEENNLYLLAPDSKSLVVINIISRKVISEMDISDNPYWITLIGEQ